VFKTHHGLYYTTIQAPLPEAHTLFEERDCQVVKTTLLAMQNPLYPLYVPPLHFGQVPQIGETPMAPRLPTTSAEYL